MTWDRRSFIKSSATALAGLPLSQLGIQGNRVLAVGGDEAVTGAAGRGARTIDLDGRTVLAGFIEPHISRHAGERRDISQT